MTYLCEPLDLLEVVFEQLGDGLRNVAILGGHVPNLRLVVNTAAEQPSASGSVAIVVTRVQVRLVLLLLLQRQVIEGLTKSELSVHFLLRDAKVGHVEEALGPDRLDQGLSQLCGALRGAIFGEINGGNCKDMLAFGVSLQHRT